ncbi:RNA polymerase II transcription elongation factor-domain-containing protein [Boeremia exigua]|uniref:RNA polymerase II transcription elongation factor-domain-containing protein n=1 Tax=Boeremia exigua TaxID=749465 RepID=UPI001E8E2CD2|nr:RNA polymerase II transcription elongation factor-domain-containing protein [Boeremia exigua]KAH6621728.1 RNA polymerase II transcription elongation factor-domain-containing protein [Boeremia exigua]
MASPMVDGRVEPHRKATYTLDVSEQIRREDGTGRGFNGVKYNHKPSLSSGTRTSKLKLADNNTYNLSMRDASSDGDKDMFVFNGARTAPSKSYVLLFDQTTQKATLERLDSTYTFNLSTKNGSDVSSGYGKIYPKKAHKDSVHDREEGEVDLFGEEAGEEANEGTQPDAANPYDFRHFLNAVKSKKETAEDRGYASSPDYRSNTATSAANTPVLPARRAVEPAPKKRKAAASVFAKKPAAKGAPKKPAAPAINLERRATDRPAPSTSQPKPSAAPPSSKIKSTEFIQSSDDSDVDAEGEPDSSFPTPRHVPRRSPSPGHRHDDDHSSAESDASSFEIEDPSARPAHLHVNAARARSPSAGPISLASAATSAAGTPRRHAAAADIDFGDLGGDDDGGEPDEDEDVDVEQMDIGPPARQERPESRKGAAAEVDEDELYMEMMEGLADSSEESEEE